MGTIGSLGVGSVQLARSAVWPPPLPLLAIVLRVCHPGVLDKGGSNILRISAQMFSSL
jgi:hypothetical protein